MLGGKAHRRIQRPGEGRGPPLLAFGSTKAEIVYRLLRARIVELELPPGTPLRRDQLAWELGISRAPVGEALSRLAAEGLVEVAARVGSHVAPIRAGEIAEFDFIRTALWIEAAECAARSPQAVLPQLQANLEAQAAAVELGDAAAFHALADAFRGALTAAVCGARVLQVIDICDAALQRAGRAASPADDGCRRSALASQARILAAIARGDCAAAARAMRAHLESQAVG